MKRPHKFHSDLFAARNKAIGALSQCGFRWPDDYGSLDLQHDVYGLEVTGIRQEDQAVEIEAMLVVLFPNWREHRSYYESQNIGEVGWKVLISRYPETFNEESLDQTLVQSIRRDVSRKFGTSISYISVLACALAMTFLLAAKSILNGWRIGFTIKLSIAVLGMFGVGWLILLAVDQVKKRSESRPESFFAKGIFETSFISCLAWFFFALFLGMPLAMLIGYLSVN